MFVTLLAITLALPLVLSLFVANVVLEPAAGMFSRLLGHADGTPWARVLQVVLVLSGIVGGVPVYTLSRIGGSSNMGTLPLTQDRWMMTVYESVLGSVEALAGTLMWVLCVAMLAYGLRRRRQNRASAGAESRAPGLAQTAGPASALVADGA